MAICRGLHFFRRRKGLLIAGGLSLVLPLLLYPVVSRTDLMHRYTEKFDMSAMVRESFDATEYFMNPNKASFGEVESYVDELFSTLPEDAYYFDNVYNYPVNYYYQDVLNEREDLNCPIVFAFWITEAETTRLANQINSLVERELPVYTSPFVYGLIEAKLNGARREEVPIRDRKIIRLS
jgi:hypothetical protein